MHVYLQFSDDDGFVVLCPAVVSGLVVCRHDSLNGRSPLTELALAKSPCFGAHDAWRYQNLAVDQAAWAKPTHPRRTQITIPIRQIRGRLIFMHSHLLSPPFGCCRQLVPLFQILRVLKNNNGDQVILRFLRGAIASNDCLVSQENSHPPAHHVAGEQKNTESEHEHGSSNFGSAHQYAPEAGPMARKPLGDRLRPDRQRCNCADRDGGADTHNEGRSDAGPKHALRQRENQYDDGTRAWSQTTEMTADKPRCEPPGPAN